MLAGPGRRIWHTPAGNAALDLRYVLERLPPGGELPVEEPLARAAMPGDAIDPPAALLKPAEKRALDLLADWPWLSRRELAALLDVAEARVSQMAVSLEGHGLATRPKGAGGRLALSDTGLALLARRDRASVGAARRRWSVAPIEDARPLDWRNVFGGRSRQLLRNIQHTAAVHGFIAALATQARSLGWRVAQLDPPHRASRHFPHQGGQRSVHPDAFGLLRRDSLTWAFLLEWERRAVRPATMAQRLAPTSATTPPPGPPTTTASAPKSWWSSTTKSPPATPGPGGEGDETRRSAGTRKGLSPEGHRGPGSPGSGLARPGE